MPKSKRSKVVSLTAVKASRKSNKKDLVVAVQEAADSHAFLYVVAFDAMRSGPFKELRAEWADSRFFLGKNRVVQLALGGPRGGEPFRPGLGALAEDVSGAVALLATSRPPAEVAAFFDAYAVADYARSGALAAETFAVPPGKLPDMPHTQLEPLRKLGLPVRLAKGVIVVTDAFTVCEAGKPLTPEAGRLLKLFGRQTATFRCRLLARWTAETGEYERLEGYDAWAAEGGGAGRRRRGAGGGGGAAGGGGGGGDDDDDDDGMVVEEVDEDDVPAAARAGGDDDDN